MTATTYHLVRSSHPEDDAEGRVFAPGDVVPNLDTSEEFNAQKIADGVFIACDSEGAILTDASDGGSTEEDEESQPDATPDAKELAQEHNIDLSTVKGTGPDGRIYKSDVEDVVEALAGDNTEGD